MQSYSFTTMMRGGKKYATTVEMLTQRELNSVLAAMFSGWQTLPHHPTMVRSRHWRSLVAAESCAASEDQSSGLSLCVGDGVRGQGR
jgi:hypothetical protein